MLRCTQTKRGPGRENWGWTPLQIAAAYGMEDVAECLVGAWGGDMNGKGFGGYWRSESLIRMLRCQ